MITMQEIFNEISKNGGLTPSRKVKEIAERFPEKIAFRNKEFGIWHQISYEEFWNQAQYVGNALKFYGVGPKDKVAVHSENRPEWIITDIGIQAIQSITVGLYPTNPSPEVKYLLGHSESKVLFAEDQEQVDKVLEVIEHLPSLSKIVYFESRGITRYDNEKLISWDEFIEIGKEEYKKDKDFVIKMQDEIKSEDTAIMIYTSGTTGPPKGSMLTHGNLEWVATQIPELSFTTGVDNPQYLSYLPLCHVFGRLVDLIIGIHTMGTINFAESIDTVQTDLAEVQPSVFPAVPRILERMHAGALVRMKDASKLKQLLFSLASKLGDITAKRRLEMGERDFIARVTNFIAQLLGFRALRKKLGLLNVDNALSGAAPISPEILRFFMSLGVPIYEGYGMTENTAVATIVPADELYLGSVGKALPLSEVRIAEDGEILTRSDGTFKGYFKNLEATKETIIDGWLHTGDVGRIDEFGHLWITDRKKDIIITAGGKNLSPSEIENRIKISPYVREAMVIGDKRKYLTALIGIESDTVGDWATRKGIPYTTYEDLSSKDEVNELVSMIINDANKDFAQVETVKYFKLIPLELDHEDGQLTATQKVKRAAITEQFAELIESMY